MSDSGCSDMILPEDCPGAAYLQQGSIPFYNAEDVHSPEMRKEMYNVFFNHTGCFGVKGVFAKKWMNKYNEWCENFLLHGEHNPHNRHPKQKSKYIINDLLERLSVEDPEMLMELINNKTFNWVLDSLLGFSTIGAFTTHWIEAGGDRQLSHVDYPCHVGSGKFWKNNPDNLSKYFTEYQRNHVLPFFSVQALIASDAMDKSNGSTEVVPGTHTIRNLDEKCHNPEFLAEMEPKFMNVKLEQGDLFVFNRGLLHRGGKNISDKRRNSAIMQCVWLWGIGQHKIPSNLIIDNLKKHYPAYGDMSEEEREDFELRIRKPYPVDTTNGF
eukprot:TRINITY_DN6979_c0_g1_i1.p1 TRINITY_DN6979_c0_g1~~TRINITY_DN6979_c0_g1_i1.p1  ORF type:complete len:326 (+),score=47.02 TRINITY_DN6979_c0_g1_i1:55-1032(+)